MAAEGNSVSTTTTVAASTVGSTAFLKWIFACIAVHHLIEPDDELLLIMCGSLAPFGHLARNALMAWLASRAGLPAQTLATPEVIRAAAAEANSRAPGAAPPAAAEVPAATVVKAVIAAMVIGGGLVWAGLACAQTPAPASPFVPYQVTEQDQQQLINFLQDQPWKVAQPILAWINQREIEAQAAARPPDTNKAAEAAKAAAASNYNSQEKKP